MLCYSYSYLNQLFHVLLSLVAVLTVWILIIFMTQLLKIGEKNKLCTCMTLFVTFPSRFMENAHSKERFLSFFFWTALRNSIPEKSANIWQIARTGIIVTKFETAQIRFRYRYHRCCCLTSPERWWRWWSRWWLPFLYNWRETFLPAALRNAL